MRGGKSVRRGKMAGRKKRLLTNKFQDFLEDSLPSEEMHDRNSDIVSPVYKPSFADVYGDQSQSHKKPPRPNVFHTGSKGYVKPISRHLFHQFLAQAVTRTEEKLPIASTTTSPIVEPSFQDLNALSEASPDLKERQDDRAPNAINPPHVTPTVHATIIVSDDDEAATKLNTTICLSDDEETIPQRNLLSAKKKIVPKRLFTDYPLRQNQIKDGGFKNQQGIFSDSSTRRNSGEESNKKCLEEAIDKINKLGTGISLTRRNSGEESNKKCFEEAINKINKLGTGISFTRMSSGSDS